MNELKKDLCKKEMKTEICKHGTPITKKGGCLICVKERMTPQTKEFKMKEINEEIKRIKDLSDFDKRNQLKGYGIKICLFLKQFYKIGDKEYKKAYCFMSKQLDKEYKKSHENLKVFNVEIEIKNKKGIIFNYNENYEERNEEEVLKRIKEKKFFNYYSRNYNLIKNPIFNKIEIKQNV